jgi:NDP-sugar pyrophosphorylase family protein
MNIIIPLCGIGKRFTDAGYDKPKPLIKVFNKLMIENVIDSLDIHPEDKLFIIYHTSLDNYEFSKILTEKYKHIHLIPISKRTNGAAETILFGLEYIINNKISSLNECLLIDCDTIYNTDILKKIRKQNTNSVIYFEDKGSNPIYSYIQLNNKKLIDIKEKEKISCNANTGAYFFKDINQLNQGCEYVI